MAAGKLIEPIPSLPVAATIKAPSDIAYSTALLTNPLSPFEPRLMFIISAPESVAATIASANV